MATKNYQQISTWKSCLWLRAHISHLVLVTSWAWFWPASLLLYPEVFRDDEDGTDLMLIGYILIALGGFCAVLGGIALFKIRQQILHAKESIDLARQRESVEQTQPKSPSTIRASMANRILSTEKLGSIQNKKVAKTLINIEVDKLGLKLELKWRCCAAWG